MRRAVVILLAGQLAACSEAAPVSPSRLVPTPPAALGTCTAVTLDGVVFERTGTVVLPVPDATIELFLSDDRPPAETARRPESQATTNGAGRYSVCFPLSGLDDSGMTPAGGRAFEVRARKEGFSPASTFFTFGYGFWDYGGMSLNLELVRQ